MPLTFSHPAIVLPFNYLPKRWVSLTGLIAGSVAPDFEYFIRMKVSSIYSHTWLGMLWFDLPVAILLTFIYHDIVRGQFIANMPQGINTRFSAYQSFNWNRHFINNLPVVVVSILIGIASHLFWDSFTHITGYFVQLWRMDAPVNVLSFKLPLYKIIQHTSTLVGGSVILVAIYKMPSQKASDTNKKWVYWSAVAGIAAIVIIVRLALGLSIYHYWDVFVTSISGCILGLMFAPILVKR